jgi:HAD superfamily 5'-nucleotidase-like hydrolase
MTEHASAPAPERQIYCNRTLNLRAIEAIGYDMDYTLIHYHEQEWEQRAYEHLQRKLGARGWPVEGLSFDPEMMERGLVLDVELGNICEANRFGFVKQACHGTRRMDRPALRGSYARTIVELAEPRYVFLNTLFSLSEGCMFAQLVDLLDAGQLPGVMGYRDLHREVRRSLDEAHMEGELKREILADPDRFVVLEPEIPLTLLDQRHAGKKLLLITNSEWSYTRELMRHAFDRFLPDRMTWRQLFDVVIVSARKPDFFSTRAPLFEVTDEEEGLLRPASGPPGEGGVYLGGNAAHVERALGLTGDQLLYVGDHVFGDVHVTKSILRWRTALILRELEQEIRATAAFGAEQRQLTALMADKERLEHRYCQLRLEQQRAKDRYGPAPERGAQERHREIRALRSELETLDGRIAPLALASSRVSNSWWGPMMRAGNDKSLLARQVERYADIYTSRVSNFLLGTPYAYLRSPRGRLPHDPCPTGGD